MTTSSIFLTLALGIGVNTAMFSVVYEVLIKPLPYPDSTRLVAVWSENPAEGFTHFTVSAPDFADWQSQAKSFEALTAVFRRRMTITGSDEPELLSGAKVSGEFWSVFGVKPQLGRSFSPAEAQAGGEKVAVISQELWRRRFQADPASIGRSLTIDGESYAVIGVMPPWFNFPADSDLWIPLVLDTASESRGSHNLQVVGRLRDGISIPQAQSEMEKIATNLAQQYPDTNLGWGVDLISLHDDMISGARLAILALFATATAVLLMACLNVANLLLVQLVAREGELAVRAALGARQSRLVQQLLTESVTIAIIGGALGLLVAMVGIRVLPKLIEVPGDEIELNTRVLIFTLIISLLAGFLIGIFPALQKVGREVYEPLKEGRRTSGGRRGRVTRTALVAAEIAFAVVLLIVAGFLLQSLGRLLQVDPGFRAQNVLTAQVALPDFKYSEPDRKTLFLAELLGRLKSLPRVEGAAATFPLPLDGSQVAFSYVIEGTAASPDQARKADVRTVTSGFFKALSIPLLRGRDFQETDRMETLPVIIINQALADREWPGQDPLGRRLTFDDPTSPEAQWLTVIGVFGNVRHRSLSASPEAEIYRSQFQAPTRNLTVVVRTKGDPLSLAGDVRQAVISVDRDLPVTRLRSMEYAISESLSLSRSSGVLCSLFALLALVLAAVGVYGVSSFSVSQRAREVGIRVALGAHPFGIVRLIVWQNFAILAIGAAIGVAIAVATLRWIKGLVYGLSLHDPLTIAAASSVILFIGVLANYLPARKISRINPALTLRRE